MAHGMLIDGVWKTGWHDTKSTGGRFKRTQPKFRNWVTPDGSAGPSGSGGFAAARGRYHLYVSLACPWAHRTVVFHKLKGLEDVISMTVVEPVMGEQGWKFGPDADSRDSEPRAAPCPSISACRFGISSRAGWCCSAGSRCARTRTRSLPSKISRYRTPN